MMSSKKSEEEKYAEALSASEEVALLPIQGSEIESAMSPSTNGQFSITSSYDDYCFYCYKRWFSTLDSGSMRSNLLF